MDGIETRGDDQLDIAEFIGPGASTEGGIQTGRGAVVSPHPSDAVVQNKREIPAGLDGGGHEEREAVRPLLTLGDFLEAVYSVREIENFAPRVRWINRVLTRKLSGGALALEIDQECVRQHQEKSA